MILTLMEPIAAFHEVHLNIQRLIMIQQSAVFQHPQVTAAAPSSPASAYRSDLTGVKLTTSSPASPRGTLPIISSTRKLTFPILNKNV